MNSTTLQVFYRLKPFLPPRFQYVLRRTRIHVLRRVHRNVWPIDERAGNLPVRWPGWPEGKKVALVLTHDVEWKDGHDTCRRLSELEESMGFRSAFYFVPRRYVVSPELRADLTSRGFEVGVHGLEHDGKLFSSHAVFRDRAKEINRYIQEWGASGFRAPAVHHNLNWIGEINIQYDASTFDTDPFQPQPDALERIFPLWIPASGEGSEYIELPYTLPQDWKVFCMLRHRSIAIWKQKLDWLAERGGMALVLTHPDYDAVRQP